MRTAKAAVVFIASALLAQTPEKAAIRLREFELTKAMLAKDKSAILALTHPNFKARWTRGNITDSAEASETREEFLDDVFHLRIIDFDRTISHVDIQGETALVELKETWTVRSPTGRQIEKRFSTDDGWFQIQGTWKLSFRQSWELQEGLH